MDLGHSILLLPFLLFASLLDAKEDSGAANKTGEVHGSVLDATSKEPIRKAFVILRKSEDAGVGTYTDDTGSFVLREVTPGEYFISAERSGFLADTKQRKQSITVKAGEAGEPIVLKLNRTGAISGHIADADGEPVTGASIQLRPLNGIPVVLERNPVHRITFEIQSKS